MNLFVLKQFELWGDYGDVLISGYYRKERRDSAALLHRAGAFLPPISFPYCTPGEIVVISDELKSALEVFAAGRVRFREAIFNQIVPVDWHTWDRNAPKPKCRPVGGEPENYLMDQKHSEETARRMAPAWEVVLDEFPIVFAHWLDSADGVSNDAQDILLIENSFSGGFFRSSFGGPAIVDDAMKDWLQARVPGWVSFQPLQVATDPGAAERLRLQRTRYANAAPHLTSDEYRTRALALCDAKSFVVPPAFRRLHRTVSRYCVVLCDETPAKLSAASYDSFDALASFVEYRCRLRSGDGQGDPHSNLQIYDLETRKRLRYLGGQHFTTIDE